MTEPTSPPQVSGWTLWLVGQGTRHRVARTALTSMVTIGTSTITSVVIARELGPSGRGHFAAIMAWFGIALVVGDVGQSASLTYHVARWPSRGIDYLASSVAVMSASGTLLALVGIGASSALSGGDYETGWAYRIAFIGCAVNGVFAPYVFAMQATSLTTWNVLRVSQPLAYLLLILALWLTHTITLTGVVVTFVISIGGQGILSLYMCRRGGLARGKVSRARIRDLTRYGVAQSASALPSAFGQQIDKILLARLVGAAPLGQYAISSSVTALATPIASAVGSAVFPRLSSREVTFASRRALERKSILSTALVLTVATVAIAWAGHWLIPLLYGEGFDGAISILWWLVPSVIARSLSGVVGDLLRARGKPSLVAWSQWSGVAVTVVGILLLTPTWGLRGAAFAVGVGQGTCLVASLWAMRRCDPE